MNLDLKETTVAACIASLEICIQGFQLIKPQPAPQILGAAQLALADIYRATGIHERTPHAVRQGPDADPAP